MNGVENMDIGKMKFRLKYENENGELKTANVEARSLVDAVAKTDDLKKLVYHMETNDRPGRDATRREWSIFLIPEPHLSKFLNSDSQQEGYLDEKYRTDDDDDDSSIREDIVNNAFTWEDAEEGSDYWSDVHAGDFELADTRLKKHLKKKSNSGFYTFPA